MKPYNKDNIKIAKILRKNQTPWERKLWFQYLRTYPIKFTRQKAIGNYIVDFYCAKASLVVELDGGQHFEKDKSYKDNERTENLQKLGLTVVRIPNNEISNNFEGVCEFINLKVNEMLK